MTLDNIKALYNEGDRETGRAQLIELIEAEPENGKAWAYLGAKSTDLEQRKYCYLKSLEFEPDNTTIQARLDKLDEYDPVAPPEFEWIDEDEEEDDPIPPELVAVKKGVKGVKNDGGMSTFQKLTLAMLSFVAVCIIGSLGVVMVYVMSDGKGLPQVKTQPTLVLPTATARIELPTRHLPTPTVKKRYEVKEGRLFESRCIAEKFENSYPSAIIELDEITAIVVVLTDYPKTFATTRNPNDGAWLIGRVYTHEPFGLDGTTTAATLVTLDAKSWEIISVGDTFKIILDNYKIGIPERFDVSGCDDFTEF